MKAQLKQAVLFFMLFVTLLSIAAVFYRYLILHQFSYDSKPIEEFTEEDL